SIGQHMEAMGKLFARFAAVAEANPLATRREGYTAERLATVDSDNRWVGFPYPRLMNSNAFIDQAAAFIMTSVGTARHFGIPEANWVFLHGCADGHDHRSGSIFIPRPRSAAVSALRSTWPGASSRTCASSIFTAAFRLPWRSPARRSGLPRTTRAG